MNYSKLISLLPWFFYLSSCEVTEDKSKLLSDFNNYYNYQPNVGHSNRFLRSVHEIDEQASGDDETQIKKHEGVQFQRNADTITVNENKATEEQKLTLDRGHDSPSLSCQDKMKCAKDKSKRHVLGGLEEQNPNDPIYIQLAEESLRKYVLESADKKPHTLLRVERVTTQVVSGSLTRIDFVAVPNDNNLPVVKKCHSEIWEQSWINKKEITVSCEIDNHRSKRQNVIGGFVEQNPNDPIYRQLAEESLLKYVLDSVDQKPHTLRKVERVTTQVISGLMTTIDFEAVPNDNYLLVVKKCHSQIWEQPWLNKKEIAVSCEIDNHRSKRQIPGGIEEKNPNDPIYRQLAEESLWKYVLESVDHEPHTLIKVDRVTSQVVSGFLTTIDFVAVPNHNSLHDFKNCHSTIWEQPRHKKKEINVSCVEHFIDRSQRYVPGGFEKQNPDDPVYRLLAEESLRKYVLQSADKIPHTLLKVERVTTQIGSGYTTRINFVAVSSDNSKALVKNCFSKIWSAPLLNKREIDVSCEIDYEKSNIPIAGGLSEQNPDDPIYQQLAEESLRKYVSQSVDQKPYTLLGVERVTTQVVAGSLIRIDFVAAPNDNWFLMKNCHSQIWEQPWHNKKEINVTCEVDNHRIKRQILGNPGGLEEKDPNDPIYRQLAEESLRKYVSESGDQKPQTILEVVRVSTQVVAGLMTRIDFKAVPQDLRYVYRCHSDIFEQRWINKKDIKVSCFVGIPRQN